MKPVRIHRIRESAVVHPADVLPLSTDGVFACDFHVLGAEQGEDVPGGYRLGRLLNVDHHAPTARMTRRVSSANLALAHVAAEGAASPQDVVVVNHTDCDSVLSAGIVAGRLDPDPALGDAAIAADHTGAANPIADLLQAVERWEDVEASLHNLALLRAGRPLDTRAAEALDRRLRRREEAAAAVARGEVRAVGRVALGVFAGEVDGEMFPALLPEAAVVLLAYPREEDPGRWTMKLRVGIAAPEGLTLHRLGLGEMDPAFGGRWNAGGNRRGGGTTTDPRVYASELSRRVERLLSTPPSSPAS